MASRRRAGGRDRAAREWREARTAAVEAREEHGRRQRRPRGSGAKPGVKKRNASAAYYRRHIFWFW
uniref:Uncharacterized protein n=1 Tax=Setaria italica TaxID=4555 RepID=K3XP24_SETIT